MSFCVKKIVVIALFFIFLGFSFQAFALNVQLFRPNIGPNGTFRLSGSETLKQKEFTLGLYANFADDPLILENVASGAVIQPIATWIFTQDLLAEVGLHRRVTVGFDMPLSLVRHTPPAGGLTTQDVYRIGDISVYGRVNLLDKDEKWLGLSLVPYVEVPSGQASHFTGDAGVNYGIKAALDKKIKRFTTTINVGYRGHAKQDFISQGALVIPLDVDDEFTYGLGAGYDVYKDRVSVTADITGATLFKAFAKNENSSPIEVLGGVRSNFLDHRLKWDVGGGMGIRRGYGAPRYRVFSGITWTFSAPEKVEPKPVRNEVKKIVISGVNFDTAKFNLTPRAIKILEANLEALNQDDKFFISVEGHTDDRGNDAYNQKLSQNRAQSVMDYFKTRVSNPSRLRATGFGESRPIAPNDTEQGRAQNRRVEIRILRVLE